MLKVHLENFERSFQNFWTFRNIFLNVQFYIFERSKILRWRFKRFLIKVRHNSESPKEYFYEHYQAVINPLKNIADSSVLDWWIQCRELIGRKDSHDMLERLFYFIQTIHWLYINDSPTLYKWFTYHIFMIHLLYIKV